jgi:hypothetical protein
MNKFKQGDLVRNLVEGYIYMITNVLDTNILECKLIYPLNSKHAWISLFKDCIIFLPIPLNKEFYERI